MKGLLGSYTNACLVMFGSGRHDLQAMNERRRQYIQALRAADGGDIGLPMHFVQMRRPA